MITVVDASVVLAALVGADDRARWAGGQLAGRDLVAPHLLPVEVARALRRLAFTGAVPLQLASDALRTSTR